MKKFLPVMMLALVTMLFSSCIIFVNENDEDDDPPKYSLTIKNNTPDTDANNITNWYVRNDNNIRFSISSDTNSVTSGGGLARLRNLNKGYYKLYVVFHGDSTTSYESTRFYLNSDKEIVITGTYYNPDFDY